MVVKRVGELACQRDSYLKFLDTVVVSCLPTTVSGPNGTLPRTTKSSKKGSSQATEDGASEKQGPAWENPPPPAAEPWWEIEFEDTILFPEGGGQPTDHGTLTSPTIDPTLKIPITRINRHGLRAVHFSPVPLDVGTPVRQHVDFERRRDHMQQHTGQHLLSAIMDTYEGLETLGWSMGTSISLTDDDVAPNMNFVELGRKPTDQEIDEIQRSCNQVISQNHRISVDTPKDAKTDSLPSDYDAEKGVVRVIRIEGIDETTCCGTHLPQTSHISLLLLHHTQPIRGTNTRLYFTAGGRAIRLSTLSTRALRSISGLLSANPAHPSEVIQRVDKLSAQVRDMVRARRKLEAEIAGYEAARVISELDAGRRAAFVHRVCEAGADFIMAVTGALKDGGFDEREGVVVLLVAVAETGGGGPVVIVGDEKEVQRVVEGVRGILPDVKGGGKGKRWQGKIAGLATAQLKALGALIESASSNAL